MGYLPVLLKLRDRPCLVVGGSAIAAGTVEALIETGARVTIISPQVTERIERLVTACQVQLVRRPYSKGDLRGFYLAYAFTGSAALDEQIAQDAESEDVLLNVADRASLCDFLSPSLVQRGDLTITISTKGRSRGFARLMQKKLECLIGPEYGDLLDVVEAERLVSHGTRVGESHSDKAAKPVASLQPDDTADNRLPKLHDGL
ncbi:MAG: bifunctional precorrin-2 dehydrogenase/sirohydrochlorin ferrochelatase [Candidatus Binatia bacterium]